MTETTTTPKLSRSAADVTRDAVIAYPGHAARWLATINGQWIIATEAALNDPTDRRRDHAATSQRLTAAAWADFLDACALTQRDPARVLRSAVAEYAAGPLLDDLPRRLDAHNRAEKAALLPPLEVSVVPTTEPSPDAPLPRS